MIYNQNYEYMYMYMHFQIKRITATAYIISLELNVYLFTLHVALIYQFIFINNLDLSTDIYEYPICMICMV